MIMEMKAHGVPGQAAVSVRVKEDARDSGPHLVQHSSPDMLKDPHVFRWDQGERGPWSGPKALTGSRENTYLKEGFFHTFLQKM